MYIESIKFINQFLYFWVPADFYISSSVVKL